MSLLGLVFGKLWKICFKLNHYLYLSRITVCLSKITLSALTLLHSERPILAFLSVIGLINMIKNELTHINTDICDTLSDTQNMLSETPQAWFTVCEW